MVQIPFSSSDPSNLSPLMDPSEIQIIGLFTGTGKEYPYYRSAIVKEPQDQLLVTEEGLPNDEHCHEFHGGPNRAVHQIPSEYYTEWDLPIGFLGENLSSTGLTSDQVCIGDIWQIGTTQLQVTQPRAPCFKTNRRTGDANFATQLDLQQTSGWFYRVVVPGLIQVSDTMELIERPYPQLTIPEVHQLAHPDRFQFEEGFEQACLDCPVLDEYWKGLICQDRDERLSNNQSRLHLVLPSTPTSTASSSSLFPTFSFPALSSNLNYYWLLWCLVCLLGTIWVLSAW